MFEHELAICEKAAASAGEVLRTLFGRTNHITKKGDIDLVTEADLESEKVILEMIRQKFPDDSILSEEAGEHSKQSDRTWIIDPLDGTTNFAHGFPFFAISIALQIKNEIVVGVVYNPVMNEYFEASRGAGTFFNKKPVKVSHTSELGESLLATGFPYDIHDHPQVVMELFEKMLVRAQGVRRPGSAAIDLCYVASGRFDGFWEQGLKPWDTAAGVVIVEEAGGKLSTFERNDYDPFKKTIVAANPFIHGAMIEVIG